MSFNIASFKTRTLTAAVFVVVMLAGLLLDTWPFFLLFSIIHFGCWFEYQKLVAMIDPGYSKISWVHRYSVQLLGWLLMIYFINYYSEKLTISLKDTFPIASFVIVLFLLLYELVIHKPRQPKNTLHSLFGLVYISLSLALLFDLRTRFNYEMEREFWNKALPFGLICSIWINDTMAYIVGSLIGKTPFSKISPKKTWEGTLGGIILCIVVITLVFGVWLKIFTVKDWIAISSIAAIAGTAGDLLESKLKRLANVKDSGHIMPGHGGFLDRFDSLLVAIPFVWIYVAMFMGE